MIKAKKTTYPIMRFIQLSIFCVQYTFDIRNFLILLLLAMSSDFLLMILVFFMCLSLEFFCLRAEFCFELK